MLSEADSLLRATQGAALLRLGTRSQFSAFFIGSPATAKSPRVVREKGTRDRGK